MTRGKRGAIPGTEMH